MISHSKPTLVKSDFSRTNETLFSGMIVAGELNDKFKRKLSDYLKKEYVSLFSSGSSGLFHILKAMNGIQKTEVLLPNYICSSVYTAIVSAGYSPVLYDNKVNSWNSDYVTIKKKITDNTLAVIINHTFGIRMPDIKKIKEENVVIIEDCCHAFSNTIINKKISEHSLCSFYSFDATKWIATGNGGAIATNDKDFFLEIENNKVDEGLPDLLCSLGLSQLDKIHEFIEKRYDIAEKYFKEMPFITRDLAKYDTLFFRFPIFSDNPDSFFYSKKVAFKRGVDQLLNIQFNVNDDFENTKDIFERTVSIPIYPSLTTVEIDTIINETIRCFYGDSSIKH